MKSTKKLWDRLGICASGFCLVHCLATPLLLIFFPSAKIFNDEKFHELFHQYIAIAVVVSILMAVYPQCRKHGHKDILYIALAGILLILAPVFLHDMPEKYGQASTILGSVFLIWAHIKNMKVRHGKCSSTKHSH